MKKLFRLKLNAVASLCEVLFNIACLFLSYKLLIQHVGAKEIGVWALANSITALGRIVDGGSGTSVTRFVAIARAGEGDQSVIENAETGIITIFGIYSGICCIMFMGILIFDRFLPHNQSTVDVIVLMPYTILSFWMLNVASAAQSCLVGIHLSFIKSTISMVASVVQLVLIALLVPEEGVKGVALAQFFQYIIIFCFAWVSVCVRLKVMPRLPYKCSYAVFMQIVKFSAGIQINNIFNILFEPLLKALIANFSDLGTLGIFEMAYRMITQQRSVIVGVISTVLPSFAHLQIHNKIEFKKLYYNTKFIASTSALVAAVFVVSISPIISLLWIGDLNYQFISFSLILAPGWMLNTMAVPSYLSAVASGSMVNNIRSSAAAVILLVVCGWPLGANFGAIGAAFASSFAIGACGVWLWRVNERSFDGAGLGSGPINFE